MSWSVEDLANYANRNPDAVTKEMQDIINSNKKNKYGNRKVEYEGCLFDSQWELTRWLELQILEKAGNILDLKRQVPFKLQDKSIIERNGVYKKQREIVYYADFVYVEGKNKVIEDAKSKATANNSTYKNKRKMLLKRYGDRYLFKESYADGTQKIY